MNMFEGYLQKRLQLLVQKHEEGSLFFNKELNKKEDGRQLLNDLTKLKRLSDGSIDIQSASPTVRIFAKSFYRINQILDSEKRDSVKKSERPKSSLNEIVQLQRDYLNLLFEFITHAFGKKPEKFAKGQPFAHAIQNYKDKKSIKKTFEALTEYMPKIQDFHAKHSIKFLDAKEYLGGFKYVVGGSSRLPDIAVDGIRKYLLYADTVFIPDPVLPWLETERIEDRFHYIRLIESCFHLLKLKPLIDTDLPYPAIIIFPSWEKLLSMHDEDTKDSISEFMIDFFSHHLNHRFDDENEIVDFITKDGKKLFREIVIRNQLFLPPGSDFPSTFEEAVKKYKEFLTEDRSDKFLKLTHSWPSEFLILNGIMERLEPQFHVRDNASMLKAHPLFWLEPHFYYYTLCSKIKFRELEKFGVISSDTLSILQSLNSKELKWLGNISINDLVMLRKDNCNEDFRKKLKEYFDTLENVKYNEINHIGAEVGRAISSLLVQHDKTAKKIQEKYERKGLIILGLSILTVGVQFFPS